MDSSRFDRLAKRFAAGVSRRSLLTGISAGGMISALGSARTAAQDDIPAATPSVQVPDQQPQWLLSVDFDSATVDPVEGLPGEVTLTLAGVDPVLVAFTDRPLQRSAFWQVDQLLAVITGAGDDPPNATLAERKRFDQESTQIVVRLLDGSFDDETSTLTLQAVVFGGQSGGTPVAVGDIAAQHLVAGFLFIDDVDGTPCTSDSQCGACAACNTSSGKCNASSAQGQSCSESGCTADTCTCDDGYCIRECRNDGQACSSADQCCGGYCTSGVCESTGPEGAPCTYSWDCQSNLCTCLTVSGGSTRCTCG